MTSFLSGLFRTRARKVVAVLLLGAVIFIAFLTILAHHAEPLLRARVIETLSTRFHSRVDLAALNVSVTRGLMVSGEGLKIYGKTDPNPQEPGVQPLIEVDHFSFRTTPVALLRVPMHVGDVEINGLTLNIPPKGSREQLTNMGPKKGKIEIFVDHFHAGQFRLVINTSRPDKLPLEFDIHNLDMKDIGPGQPLQFRAQLVNPKPLGDIASQGEFGPFDADDPRESPVRGHYTFTHADLSTIKGIGGILSSTGQYQGTLGSIVVDGQTDTPDFRISIGGRGVPLKTNFHATVDGTSGNTYLEPVHATLFTTQFTATGQIVRANPKGHHIQLDVTLPHGRIEHLLLLAMKKDPPIMTGKVQLHAKLDLPPGEEDFSDRLFLQGRFEISGVRFSNPEVQGKIDALSLRSQGKPEEAAEPTSEDIESQMGGDFTLKNRSLDLPNLSFQVPGTRVALNGNYSLEDSQFEFHGHAMFDARLSHMVGGWKSLLLTPLDPFFHKHGAGADIPIKITGTKSGSKSDVHFGLDLGHKSDAESNHNAKPQGGAESKDKRGEQR